MRGVGRVCKRRRKGRFGKRKMQRARRERRESEETHYDGSERRSLVDAGSLGSSWLESKLLLRLWLDSTFERELEIEKA